MHPALGNFMEHSDEVSSSVLADYQEVSFQANEKIDPISVLAVLALIRFKEESTKIRVIDFSAVAQQPSDFNPISHYINVQGLLRRGIGSSREDLDVIQQVVRKASLWWRPDLDKDGAVYELMKHAQEGLKSLKKTYKKKGSGVTVMAIRGYERLIKKAFKKELSQKYAQDLGGISVSEDRKELFKNLWKKSEIELVCTIVRLMHEKQSDLPVTKELCCSDEIEQLELLLSKKAVQFAKSWK